MMHKSVMEVTRIPPQFSLEELCLIKVITNLCNSRQMLRLILKCNFQTDVEFRLGTKKGTEWEAVRAKADELVSQMRIGVLLQKKVLDLLWPMCYRILFWKSIYAPTISNRFLKRFYWTDRGRIDKVRTVQYMIGNKNIAARKRFALASSVCLREELRVMWRELSSKDKRYFSKTISDKIHPLLLFWVYTLEGGSRRGDEYRHLKCNAVRCAVEIGSLEALKYLFAISREGVRKSLANNEILFVFFSMYDSHFLDEDGKDIGCFLFFELSDVQQQVSFQDTNLVLSLLLHSSEYELYLRLLEERLESLSEYSVTTILRMIFYTYHLEIVGDNGCRELFVDVWRKIPYSKRSYTKGTIIPVEFLCVLIKDKFPFLLEKYEFRKKSKFTLEVKFGALVKPADLNKWKFLHFLIQEEVVTITNLKKYRKHALSVLGVTENTRSIWAGVMRFVCYVASKSPNQSE